MRAFEEDLEAGLARLKLPPVHRKHVRATNLIERSFEEERVRAKVIPRFRGGGMPEGRLRHPVVGKRALAPGPVQ